MKTFPAIIVANFFVKKSIDEDMPISNLKVNKLVYLAHGWHLGLHKKPLIREDIEAWQFGPVVRSVYDAFKKYGKHSITKTATTGFSDEMKEIGELADADTIQFLGKIWNHYRDWKPWQLSALTHEDNSPWDLVCRESETQNPFEAVIPEKTIKDHYAKRLRESRES